ncbi:C69 family dipeptidase [Prevotella copri]|uniref:Dipeptidase n=1 Tax=Segatella copri TaxID=165179 RepID=A0AAW5ILD9_9BACT|nr:C69 family dipeptidase [Segatella copri]MCP9535073.1 C69 family dipeptidase [Segatella copri]MCP9538130.1 C69 family dipeptidase [Segatella copri]MCP9540950.1 C69 family dipeptidase [Segatella copri]MCP9559290.1 C69 family dipeptidase [Segatella copri]MCP9562079.1 C69 family dipeptidase [Segatella copri]
MNKIFASALMAVAMLGSVSEAEACSNFIVGKKASVDGSVMCSYSADDYGMFQYLCHYPAAKHAKGEMRKIFDWDSNKYYGEIPEAAETYNVIGNINEWQVTIGETTYGGREEMVDSTGIMDYGSLIYVALQRSKTAREAIKVMTTLANTYGYNSGGETFTICDPNEAWIMEMMGKGAGSQGAVWVALRIPDDAICAHANQSRIGKFNMKDKKNVMYAKDVVSFARSKGWFKGKDADFSWKMAYAKPDFSGRRFCDARAWAMLNHFYDMSPYLDWALGKNPDAQDMPLWVVPNKKVSVKDVENVMRDHYEGTPLSVADGSDIGGGIWEMPYRPTPLMYKVDGKQYFNERPVSTQQSGFVFVSQMRSWLPREIGGVFWFANDDANMAAFTPVYCSMTERPECYNTPGADALHFSKKNAYWVCNMTSNMVYPRYSLMFPTLKEVRDSLDNSYFAAQAGVEKKAQELYAQNPQAAVKYLNDYSVEKAQQMLARWNQLFEFMVVKYNDMIIKPTDKNGTFKKTPYGLGATPVRPGYPEKFAKQLVKQSGDKFLVPEEKK